MVIKGMIQSFRAHQKKAASVPMLMLSLLLCTGWITSMIYVPTIAPVTHANLGALPLAFVPNLGQTASQVLFQVHDLDGTVFMTASELILALPQSTVVRLAYLGAQSALRVTGGQLLPGSVNYLIGSNPARWHTHVPIYSSVVYQGLYPGIDLRYLGQSGTLESVYDLAPGADASQIRWRHSGAAVARVDAKGRLLLYRSAADTKPLLVEHAPLAWQVIAGKRVPVASRYIQHTDGSFGFKLGAYNPAYSLTIDPTLVYSSYFGGSEMDTAGGIALDGSGNIYIAGTTNSVDFPRQSAMQSANHGWTDAFVMKLNPAGDTLLYGTYLGGGDDDDASGLAVDTDGNAYIIGDTSSNDFPTHNAYAAHCALSNGICIGDAFLAKLSPTGSSLLYGTYLGGANPDSAAGIAVDDEGSAYLAGATFSTGFPTRGAYQASLKGPVDAFVTRLDTTLTGSASLVYSTFLGGSASDFGSAIALDGERVVVTGQTVSTNFPTRDPLQAASKGAGDIFITSLSPQGDSLVFSTYLGGSHQDYAYAVATSVQGDAYLTGNTLSTDFPTLSPFQDASGGASDAFITGISAAGDEWLLSTYWGGSGAEYGYAIGVDGFGDLYLAGETQSGDFPLENSIQGYKGKGDAFAAKFVPGEPQSYYSTLLGGSDSDYAGGLDLDDEGNLFLVGVTYSTNFPTLDPLYDSYAGNGDVFVAKINDLGENPPVPTEEGNPTPLPTPLPPPHFNPLFGSYKTASQCTLLPGETLTFSIHLHNSGTSTVSADVVDKLPAGVTYQPGSADPAAVYNSAGRTLTWEGVDVPAGEDILLNFEVTTNVQNPTVAVNTASITADGDTFDRKFAVVLGSHPIAPDVIRPVVESFTIDQADVLASQEVTLHTQVSDSSDAKWMLLREWQLSSDLFPHWELVESTGWIPFDASFPWTLGDQSGVHYMTIWVADGDENVSLWGRSSFDFASLVLPDTDISQAGLVPYLVYYEAGESVTATLTPANGDADLYVWYPDSFIFPDQVSAHPGKAEEQVHFTAPADGIYIFLVHGFMASTYDLSITPVGGAPTQALASQAVVGQGTSVTRSDGLIQEPVFNLIGLDPFGTQGPAAPGAPSLIYIPMISR